MKKRNELDEAISAGVKKSGSYWYWVFGLTGLILHYIISGIESKMDVGVYLALLTTLVWGGGLWDVYRWRRERVHCLQRIATLETIWHGAIGNRSDFWRLEKFDLVPDWDDDSFSDWWLAQTNYILFRVCEFWKAKAISEQREQEHKEAKNDA